MASSVVSICNQALTLLGDTTVTEVFPPDEIKGARLCNTHYEAVRDAMTREHQWNCAMVRAQIAALGTTPINGYLVQYQRSESPFDIRVWSVNEIPEENVPTMPFKVEGRLILTDESAPIKVRFAKRMTNPAEMDSLFEEALAFRLAARLAYPLTGSRQMAEDMFNLYINLRSTATGADGQEGTTNDAWDADLLNVR